MRKRDFCGNGHGQVYKKTGAEADARKNFLCRVQKDIKKPGSKPWESGKYALTKSEQHDTMTIHTVILCLFLDFTSNMVILPQDRDDVKHQVE